MRKKILTLAAVAVLGAAYSAWPFYSLYDLVRVAQAGDASAVSERVDFRALRRSLSEQVMRTYMQLTGQSADTLAGRLAVAVGGSIADPLVAEIVTPEAITALVAGKSAPPEIASKLGDLRPVSLTHSAWRLYASSEYGFDEFRLWVPPDAALPERYRLVLERSGGAWKLSGILLPQELQEKLARQLIDQRGSRG